MERDCRKQASSFQRFALMSTKSREVIFGSRIRGAKIRAEGARERARQAIREADRAEAEAWSIRMEGYGGPAKAAMALPRGDEGQLQKCRLNGHKSAWLLRDCYHQLLPPATKGQFH